MQLNVTEATFKKYLLSHKISVDILDYRGLIDCIRSTILSDLIVSINDTSTIFMDSIFYQSDFPSLYVFRNPNLIDTVKDSYIINLITSGCLSQHLIDKEINYPESVHINAYKLLLLNKIDRFSHSDLCGNKYVFSVFLSFIKENTQFFTLIKSSFDMRNTNFQLSSNTYAKVISLPTEDISLSIERKNEIEFELDQILTDFKNRMDLNTFENRFNINCVYGISSFLHRFIEIENHIILDV